MITQLLMTITFQKNLNFHMKFLYLVTFLNRKKMLILFIDFVSNGKSNHIKRVVPHETAKISNFSLEPTKNF